MNIEAMPHAAPGSATAPNFTCPKVTPRIQLTQNVDWIVITSGNVTRRFSRSRGALLWTTPVQPQDSQAAILGTFGNYRE